MAQRTRRRPLGWMAGALVVLIVIALGAVFVVWRIVFGGSPTVLHSQQTPAPLPTCVSVNAGQTPQVFRVDSQHSTASYQAHFLAAGQTVPGVVTGVTGAVSGDFVFFLGPGLSVQTLKITIDLRTLNSGAPQRDAHVRNDTLETSKYPYAIFAISTPETLLSHYTPGQPVSFKLPGLLTLHGVTRPVVFAMQGITQGNSASGDGVTTIHLRDFQVKPPMTTSSVPITISDTVLLRIQFQAQRESCVSAS